MTFKEARDSLLFHAGFVLRPNQRGLLGKLRPYEGLLEEDFAQIVQALVALHPHLSSEATVDRQIVAALWFIETSIRVQALRPNGLLRSNNLISDSDFARLSQWFEIFDSMTVQILQGLDLPFCMYHILEYLSDCDKVELRHYYNLLPYVEMAIAYDDHDVVDAASRAFNALAGSRTGDL